MNEAQFREVVMNDNDMFDVVEGLTKANERQFKIIVELREKLAKVQAQLVEARKPERDADDL
jgi:hypothetical protein